MSVTAEIVRNKVSAALQPMHLEVEDFSDCGCGLKFNVLVVSNSFADKPLLARHRMVNEALSEELKTIHALTMKTYTPEQWKVQQEKSASQ